MTTTTDTLTVRDATAEDAQAIARLLVTAGGGLYEFLLDDLIPEMGAVDVLTHLIEAGDSPLGWPEVRVATGNGGQILGMVNAFPTERRDELQLDMLPADRLTHVAPLMNLRDPGSMLINAMAVLEDHRRRDIGRRLVAEGLGMAGAEGRKRASLWVWSTNRPAIQLYEEFKFVATDHIDLPHHPRLSARRAILMVREV